MAKSGYGSGNAVVIFVTLTKEKSNETKEHSRRVASLAKPDDGYRTRYGELPRQPGDYVPSEYFEDVKDAALDAHMLVTWVRDNLKGETQ